MAEPATPAEPVKKKSKAMMTLTIVVGVAVLEGAAFFAVIKFAGGGPGPSYGGPSGEHVMEAAPPPPETTFAEVALLQRFKVPNHKGGTTVIYDIDLSVVVPASRKPQMEEVVKNRGSEISDRVAQIIRQASTRTLSEDDFGTLRMQLKQALSEIVGDDQTVQRVLIPRCVPLPTD